MSKSTPDKQRLLPLNETTFKASKQVTGDIMEVEVGDSKQSHFYPQIKLMRWNNEANFSIRYNTPVDGTEQVDRRETKEEIRWRRSETEVRLYTLEEQEKTLRSTTARHKRHQEGGFEFEVVFDEKPQSNIVEFTVRSKGLEFYYQPPLTDEEIELGFFRPEDVEGSYAVYHKEKKDDYSQVGGKNYGTGKAFHIYRPVAHDAAGTETYCDLHIDTEAELLTVTVPQKFLDSAVYPVIVDPTFGYTTAGASQSANLNTSSNTLFGSVFAGADGTATNISAYLSGSGSAKVALYQASNSALLASTTASTFTSGAWKTYTISDTAITAQDYVPVATGDSSKNSSTLAYDAGTTNQGKTQAVGSNSFPSTASFTNNNNKYSIYVTYTAGAVTETILAQPIFFD